MGVKCYYVYILASKKNGTLYVGVTNDLLRRVHEHKYAEVPGFAKRYGVDKLVYYETFTKVYDALTAEKRLKAWKRPWKIELIEKDNPEWHDLYDVLTGQVDSCLRRNDRVGSGGSLRIARSRIRPAFRPRTSRNPPKP
jgi:putative endonuclease